MPHLYGSFQSALISVIYEADIVIAVCFNFPEKLNIIYLTMIQALYMILLIIYNNLIHMYCLVVIPLADEEAKA